MIIKQDDDSDDNKHRKQHKRAGLPRTPDWIPPQCSPVHLGPHTHTGWGYQWGWVGALVSSVPGVEWGVWGDAAVGSTPHAPKRHEKRWNKSKKKIKIITEKGWALKREQGSEGWGGTDNAVI